MGTFLIVVTVISFVSLVLVAAMQPVPGLMSAFELDRRAKNADREAKAALHRLRFLSDIHSLLRVKTALLLVTTTILLIVTFGWLIGVIAALVIALEHGAIARLRPVQRVAGGLYRLTEPQIIRLAEKAPLLFTFIRGVPLTDTDVHHRFDSREELQRLIEQAGNVLSADERALIVHALDFPQHQVKSIMTARKDIKFIKKTEFLGPLVLSELHELGHTRLPVIAGSLDRVVGVLHLDDLLSLDIKQSVTAEKAMVAKVHYLKQDDSLEKALAAFLKGHYQLAIVTNDDKETVGLLTLQDVIEALLGRSLADEEADD
jgi:CBS domain containing-hemolysin-like protein